MEVSRTERFLDENMPHFMTVGVYVLVAAFFGHLMHDFAASISYDLLCIAWFASVFLMTMLITQWNTLRNNSYGFLAAIIGQENAMLLMLIVSTMFSFIIPLVILYKWLVLSYIKTTPL
jgi:hypothetical protein